ncbi:MAG: hypothetical protein ACKO1L_01140 [Brachymonas sp.]
MRRRWLALLWGLVLWGVGLTASSAPLINWTQAVALSVQNNDQANVSLDLRSRWEATKVGAVDMPNQQALAPESIWQWPDERFSTNDWQGALRMRADERLVTRLTVVSEQLGTDFTLSLKQPRLDAVHVSYRYDNGP